jgi:peptide/nickel transport system permease protein
LLYGGRVSLLLALISTLLSAAIGTAIGLVAGFKGGMADAAIMHAADAFLCFPVLMFILAIAAALGSGLHNLALALVVFGWTFVLPVMRGGKITTREDPAPCRVPLHVTAMRPEALWPLASQRCPTPR